MKAFPRIPALLGALGLAVGTATGSAHAQPADNPPPATAPAPRATAAEARSDAAQTTPSPEAEKATGADAKTAEATPTAPATPLREGETGLRMNFRNAPLDLVLNYLSEAAGFIVVLEAEVKGKIDVLSNQPLDKEEAVELLNRVLNKNGYAAIRDGRTLTIVSQDEAKKRDIPVRAGSDPNNIPKGHEMITQVLPVKFINAVQLSRDLASLFPSTATVAANEGGNSLVITDTETNIRRIAEIIKALDTGISAVSSVKVYSLKYADAKALATTVRDLFQTQDNARGGNNQTQQQFRGPGGGFPGGGFPGGFGGNNAGGNAGGGRGGNAGSTSARVASPRVVAVADERSNSLVVSAPSEQIPVIDELVAQVDTNVDDITELRVFRLKFADPQEMADLIGSLFPDPSRSTSGNQGGGAVRFGGVGGFFGGNRQGGATASDSTRLQKQNRVTAVADLRTSSVIVTAAPNLLEQISGMIAQLDGDPAKKQKVFVYSVENTDPTSVQTILQGLFETQNNRNRTTTRNNTQVGNQLNTRAQQSQNQGRNNTGLGGSTGFGSGNGN